DLGQRPGRGGPLGAARVPDVDVLVRMRSPRDHERKAREGTAHSPRYYRYFLPGAFFAAAGFFAGAFLAGALAGFLAAGLAFFAWGSPGRAAPALSGRRGSFASERARSSSRAGE